MRYDIFISHASEDKAEVARPLAYQLKELGLKVWLDEFELTLGDSLRRKIDWGLAHSRFGVVVLSDAFFSKEWPNRELDALVAREDGRDKVILPVWHRVGYDDIVKHSPILAGKLAASTSVGLESVASQIHAAIERSNNGEDSDHESGQSTEEKTLEQLSHQMIAARNSFELRRTVYEIEAYLEQYPRSLEARMLKDRASSAMAMAEMMEQPSGSSPPPPAGNIDTSRPRHIGITTWLLRLVGLAAAGYALYWILQILIS